MLDTTRKYAGSQLPSEHGHTKRDTWVEVPLAAVPDGHLHTEEANNAYASATSVDISHLRENNNIKFSNRRVLHPSVSQCLSSP
jgi:hypothetical protein